MLILSRRIGEKIRIDDEVSITILGIKGKQVRIGIEAPKKVSVHREEVYQKIVEQSWKSKQPLDSDESSCNLENDFPAKAA